MVLIELNKQILEREPFDTTIAKEINKVEFLYFAGGVYKQEKNR